MAGKRGAPKGNLNNIRHGAAVGRLTLGEYAKTHRRQLQNARKYRRLLEQLVRDTHGREPTPTENHLIDEAATAEIHAAVCRNLLKDRFAKMTIADVIRCSEQVVKAKTIRNKAVERLQLDAKPQAPWIDA